MRLRIVSCLAALGIVCLALLPAYADPPFIDDGGGGGENCTNCWHVSGPGPAVDLAIQPFGADLDDDLIVAAVQGSSPGIYRSINGGVSFTKVKVFSLPHRVASVAGLMYAATSQGLFKATNQTLTTWTQVLGGLPATGGVTFVKHILGELTVYASAGGATTRGLYRSEDLGSTWTRILPDVDAQAVAQARGCVGNDQNLILFAGGKMAPGGLACTLWMSRDHGQTWSCTSFPSVVNDLQLECGSGVGGDFQELHVTNGDVGAATQVYRSVDLGASFTPDDIGMPDGGASNISSFGTTVGSLTAGIFERQFGPAGTPWSQFDVTELTDRRIKRWITWGFAQRFVVATPSGIFYHD